MISSKPGMLFLNFPNEKKHCRLALTDFIQIFTSQITWKFRRIFSQKLMDIFNLLKKKNYAFKKVKILAEFVKHVNLKNVIMV